MESFRNLIKGWLGKLLLTVILVLFAFVGMEGYFSGGLPADAAKTVNGEVILKKDLDNQTNAFKTQYLKYTNGDETLLNLPFIENAALESLIARNLLIQQAEKLGITLSDDQIKQMLAQQEAFKENGKFSKTLYDNYLKREGLTSQGLIQSLRQDFALNILRSSIALNALVSKQDVDQIQNLRTEKRDLYLSSINLDSYKAGVKVSDQDISNYYNSHQNQFKQPELFDVDYVVLSPSMLDQTPAAVTDEELQQAYNQFVAKRKTEFQQEVKHILISVDSSRTDAEAKKLADEVFAKIKAGESFAQAAAQYSDDTTSKNKGGVLSYSAGTFGEDFDKTVAANKGQVSAPVKTTFGYHLIETKAISEPIPAFDVERARLSAELAKTKSENLFIDTVNRLNTTVSDNDALDVVSQEVKATQVQSVKSLMLSTQHPVLSDPNVKIKIFNEAVRAGDQNASSNLALANGDVVWVKVRAYHPAAVQPLNQVSAKVKTQLIEQKAFDAAKAKINSVLDDFKKLPAQQVLAKHALKFEHAGEFTRSQGLKRKVEQAAFSLTAPKAGMWSVNTAALPNELVIVAVASVVKPPQDAVEAAQISELTKLYQQQRGEQLLGDYTEYLKAKAKIK